MATTVIRNEKRTQWRILRLSDISVKGSTSSKQGLRIIHSPRSKGCLWKSCTETVGPWTQRHRSENVRGGRVNGDGWSNLPHQQRVQDTYRRHNAGVDRDQPHSKGWWEELTALLRRQPFAPSLSEGTTPVDTFIEQSFASRGGIICNLNDRSAPPPVQSDHWSDTGSDYQKGKYFETIYW
jgi:hypothetical protein